MFITDALALSVVPRWVVVRTLRPSSVAEHSFNVAIIADEIVGLNPHLTNTDEINHGIPVIRRANLLWYALTHDCDEAVTGDIPRYAKKFLRLNRDTPTLVEVPRAGVTLPEIQIVKLADIIEAYTFIAMNGVGSHAAKVADRLKVDIHNYVRSIDHLLVQPELIYGLYAFIEAETGREYATGSMKNPDAT